jgi:hypothetical protein
MPADFALDRADGGGRRRGCGGVGHGGAPAGGTNADRIADLLEYRNNLLIFLFYTTLRVAQTQRPAASALADSAARAAVNRERSPDERCGFASRSNPAAVNVRDRARTRRPGVVSASTWGGDGARPGRARRVGRSRVQARVRRNPVGDRGELPPCILLPIRPRRGTGSGGRNALNPFCLGKQRLSSADRCLTIAFLIGPCNVITAALVEPARDTLRSAQVRRISWVRGVGRLGNG